MLAAFVISNFQEKFTPWIGGGFAVGSIFFAVASTLALSFELANFFGVSGIVINKIFFVGSIPFTTAAYLQLVQSANGFELNKSSKLKLFGWYPTDTLWLSSALQFAGTLLFNINTFDAMLPNLTVLEEDLLIWVPNIEGSILFLVSGYLAFKFVSKAWWAFKPRNVDWWCAWFNLMGCIGFIVSALFSVFLPGVTNPNVQTIALAFTLQGALCFLVGALLMFKN